MNSFESTKHQLLYQLCEQQDLQGLLHGYDYICGLIFAVAAAPEIPMPEQWLVWAFQQRGQLSSVQQADELTDVLMGMLQQQLRLMRDEQVNLANRYQLDSSSYSNSPLSEYCTGLLAGHSQLEPVWHTSWQRMQVGTPEKMLSLQKDFRHCLGMFSTFADIPLAIEQAKQRGNSNFESLLPKLWLSLPGALQKYVSLSGDLVDFLPDQFETFVKPVN